ncbi:recombinase family protein [uncultured Caulobacter sp.]|uniref:recombinase family protein n=1 Tax=uncultured Caulobacter sp. TaxID=158749 RepID=UPI00262A7CB7|nr:recombinase family protein [uncultured Caulobacter sp.]
MTPPRAGQRASPHAPVKDRIRGSSKIGARAATSDNQVREIEAAGFKVEPKRIIKETISGSHAAMERPEFAKLVDRLESGDVLIFTKLDRLGRNAMDVRATVERLASDGVRVHCLALGGVDLISPAGKMTMGAPPARCWATSARASASSASTP